MSPELGDVVFPIHDDPGLLIEALRGVPHTLVHGDWKAANLGTHEDGRTVLLDFGELPGEASPLADVAWYLALNADLLPEAKDAAWRGTGRLWSAKGSTTQSWWEAALELELLGCMVQFGWEKALGGSEDELAWWVEMALRGARRHLTEPRLSFRRDSLLRPGVAILRRVRQRPEGRAPASRRGRATRRRRTPPPPLRSATTTPNPPAGEARRGRFD